MDGRKCGPCDWILQTKYVGIDTNFVTACTFPFSLQYLSDLVMFANGYIFSQTYEKISMYKTAPCEYVSKNM